MMDRLKILVDGGGHGYSIALFPKNERYYNYQKGATNNEAEYNGVILALEKLPEDSKAIILTDSQLIVGQLTQGWNINYDHLYEKTRKIESLIDKKNLDVEFKWFPREKNTADLVLRKHLIKIGVEVKEPLYEKVKRLEKENKQLTDEIKRLKDASQKDA